MKKEKGVLYRHSLYLLCFRPVEVRNYQRLLRLVMVETNKNAVDGDYVLTQEIPIYKDALLAYSAPPGNFRYFV